ncbi:hypothetical protein ABPG72_016094 [Tetrahymena utriculariae]
MQPSSIDQELKKKAQSRQKFMHNGQTVYQWDQTIDDVNIYIQPPKFVLKKYENEVRKQLQPGQPMPKLEIIIEPRHLKIGIKGNPPFINENLTSICDTDDSTWCIEDEELHIILQKGHKGEVWQSVFVGHDKLDPLLQQEIQKKLMLERFQEENPGFDFSGAEFNGQAPDPRNFMGGIKYN